MRTKNLPEASIYDVHKVFGILNLHPLSAKSNRFVRFRNFGVFLGPLLLLWMSYM